MSNALPIVSKPPECVELSLCQYCYGKITRPIGSSAQAWVHMATVGPDGKSQHGQRKCPPQGSRP
jgi:hypothetical protein